ncbi:glycosyltransferase [Pantoea sp. UYEF8]|uniref:glycosyltransferase n=1 Tax=Pantoea sp. UYEF8 TaxID=1756394 RepID=UPI003390A7DB
MKKIVHIKISDKGWILEKLAHEISKRLPYVGYGLDEDANAKIQYYMTYGCRKERVSPIEIALFTHKEEVPSAAAKFDAVAAAVDFCVAQSLKTESIIRETGLSNIQTISPGVDLDKYSPVVRIGVVGRTYHTGRKGEKLVAQVMDLPGIEWHFTGEGWPGPAKFIPDEELPAFYRSLDYILVPALIEGGPMCVLEALASGCKIIAPSVGWVPQFPHIEFKVGDAEDLRRVLMLVVEEKMALRRTVESYTWQAWADKHHALFTDLLGQDPLSNNSADQIKKPTKMSALVAVHGTEMTASLGGPSVRAPRTVEALRKLSINADFVSGRKFSTMDVDVVHALNVWHPDECEVLLRQIEKNNCPSVFSPIFLDLSEIHFFNLKVKHILSESETAENVYDRLEELRHENALYRQLPLTEREPFPNYYMSVRRLVSYAKHLIFLSEHERKLLEQIGVSHQSTSIVKNPVNAAVFENGDPSLFREQIGVENYILCVGRIEARKNQALLALALRDSKIPLVLIGHVADEKYAELIKKWGGDNVIFAGRVESNSPMLASAFAGAKVFCLPSWSEGAPLVALEAAASGCNMVLSDRSSEKEYFGNLARYVNPADVNDIREKVLSAWNDTAHDKSLLSQTLKQQMKLEHSWEKYAANTKSAYEEAIISSEHNNFKFKLSDNKKIYIDLTTLAHHNAPPTGIARVESRMAENMHNLYGNKVNFIIWNSHYCKFIKVTYEDFVIGRIKRHAGKYLPGFKNGIPESNVEFHENDIVLTFGGAWIRNQNYLRDLLALKQIHKVALVSTVYDVIQHKMKFLFPDGVGDEFAVNCKKIISISDMVMTCSEQSRNDIIDFCIETQTPVCPISVFRLGDEAVHIDTENNIELQREGLGDLAINDKFVLFVSTIDVRKNHSLLLMLWKGLISEYGDAVPKLVLVGSIGWRGQEAINILNDDPALKEKVLMLHGIKDSALDWLYKNCLFTVFPSRYEGWGLPVAESCRYGKFCLASDAGSLPEVAPGCAEYIDPLDFIAWYKALQKYCFEPDLLAVKTNLALSYQPTDWHQTAQQVINSLENLHSSVRLPSLALDNVISFAAENNKGSCKFEKFTLNGWYKAESRGCWSSGHEAFIGFQYDQTIFDDLSISIQTFGYCPEGEAIKVNVFINNVFITKQEVFGSETQILAPIPESVIKASRNLIVKLHIENPKSPSQFGASDARYLGLHVRSVTLRRCSPTSGLEHIVPISGEGVIQPAQNNTSVNDGLPIQQKLGFAFRLKRKINHLKNKIYH